MSKINKNVVVLDRGNYTTCTIHLHGGTILSYRVKNKEMLYMGRKAVLNTFSPIRGGIQFTFPYYGNQINGPKHGFARYVPWKLEEGPLTLRDGNVQALFSLQESEYTKAIWNYKFKISFRLTLCINELRIELKVENTSKYFPFRFTIMRHSVFKVHDVRECEVYGLSGTGYFKLDKDMLITPVEFKLDQETLPLNRSCYNLFINSPASVEVHNIDKQGLKLKIISMDSASTDTLIHNSGANQRFSTVNPDVYGENYLNYLGVGSGNLRSEIRLEPKEVWKVTHIIQVVDEEYNNKINKLEQLLDNPLELFKASCKKTEMYS